MVVFISEILHCSFQVMPFFGYALLWLCPFWLCPSPVRREFDCDIPPSFPDARCYCHVTFSNSQTGVEYCVVDVGTNEHSVFTAMQQ